MQNKTHKSIGILTKTFKITFDSANNINNLYNVVFFQKYRLGGNRLDPKKWFC